MARPGFFNFRIVTASVPELLRHLPAIWHGRYESSSFMDFLANDIHLEFDCPMPFQVGGDSEGYRSEVHYRLADFSVEVFNFLSP